MDERDESLSPAPADVVAWEQTGGIGRSGGGWSSPPGKGVYLTSIRGLASQQRIQTLPLAIGAAVCAGKTRGKWWPGTESNCRHGNFQLAPGFQLRQQAT